MKFFKWGNICPTFYLHEFILIKVEKLALFFEYY